MIHDIAAHILAYAAMAAPDAAAALEILGALPDASTAVTAAVLSLGLPEYASKLAIQHGHARRLLRHYPTPMIADSFADILVTAARMGDLDTLAWLYKHYGPKSICHAEWSASGIPYAAASTGNIEVLAWFSSLPHGDTVGRLNDSDVRAIGSAAAAADQATVLDWMEGHGYSALAETEWIEAVRLGRMAVNQWWWTKLVNDTKTTAATDPDKAADNRQYCYMLALRTATQAGHEAILESLAVPEWSPKLNNGFVNAIINTAFSCGSARVLDWWWTYHRRHREDTEDDDSSSGKAFGTFQGLVGSTPHMSRDVVEWVADKIERGELLCADSDHPGAIVAPTLQQLVPNGFGWKVDLAYIDWWWTTCQAHDWPYPHMGGLARRLAAKGDIAGLDWAWKNVRAEAGFHSEATYFDALQANQVAVLEWLWAKGTELYWPSFHDHMGLDDENDDAAVPTRNLAFANMAGIDWWHAYPGISANDLVGLYQRSRPFSAFELCCRAKIAQTESSSAVPLISVAAINSAADSPFRLMSLHRELSILLPIEFLSLDMDRRALLDHLATAVESVALAESIRMAAPFSLTDLTEVAPRGMLGKASSAIVMWWARIMQRAAKRIVLPVLASELDDNVKAELEWQLGNMGIEVYTQDPESNGGVVRILP
ncbi:hypothetical protein BC828DRAFT_393702 [Blastocladiella britannica]|nr:hypothetical protein BC828DRAFT_393702 [Blastocladiella britannica]